MTMLIIIILMFLVNNLIGINCAIVGWGELCNHTDECADHRMICKLDKASVYKCECDRFHQWQGIKNGCIQIIATKTILNMTINSNDNKGDLERDQHQIFFGHKIAGFFVMSVALVCPLIIAVHCCHMKRKDRKLKSDVHEINERVQNAKNKQQIIGSRNV